MEKESLLTPKSSGFVSTRNACKLCAPLGASIAYRGVEGCVPLVHGSQGCATYIRRYLISHFREPIDIASTNFTEDTTVFGGAMNLKEALNNISEQYKPDLIGVCTTCLSETIGEDVPQMLKIVEMEADRPADAPRLVAASTPSYQGTHAEGYREAVYSLVKRFSYKPALPESHSSINLFPGLWSPADLRHLKEIMTDFSLDYTLMPDYSDTLDNPIWDQYHRVPGGGTPLQKIRNMGGAKASIEFGVGEDYYKLNQNSGASYLEEEFDVPKHSLLSPIGIDQTDKFFELLNELSGKETPIAHTNERGRLIDAYVDGHKYVFGKKVVIYGDEDMVMALTSFLKEVGIIVSLAASGSEGRGLKKALSSDDGETTVMADADFEEIREFCLENKPDLIIGNSKGYNLAREIGVPLVRIGFPVHDRIGAQRILHVGYRGAQNLFDTIVNTLLQVKQDKSPVGYKYL
ncbi:nitrogenase component 1 [Marinilabilia rubra]|uniref:Nitrogenase n=1 Tax=Marinilabilia rubra TaxID=2162893 RepID=A0A2U2BBW6_9BACT|nr:nitrogenase component 1 [Marinilabilia rubra]PWE00564.1 nitrogenase [Marinilabilia rubra]